MATKPKTYWAVVDKKGKLIETDVLHRDEDCACHAWTATGLSIFKTKSDAQMWADKWGNEEKVVKIKFILTI